MKLLAIVPGPVTGWATFNDDHFGASGEYGPREHHGDTFTAITIYDPDVVICESYGVENSWVKLEYIGVVKAAAMLAAKRLVLQGLVTQEWATDIKLKRTGVTHTNWYLVRQQVAAQRHILYYLAHNTFVEDSIRRAVLRSIKPKPGS
ncbi:MAG: hypothetical protein ABSG46_20315 [Candidatus Binataceae bacterium]